MSIESIDTTLCNGCRLCIDTCPMDFIRLDTVVKNRELYINSLNLGKEELITLDASLWLIF